jgi:hypothetical protein
VKNDQRALFRPTFQINFASQTMDPPPVTAGDDEISVLPDYLGKTALARRQKA